MINLMNIMRDRVSREVREVHSRLEREASILIEYGYRPDELIILARRGNDGSTDYAVVDARCVE